VQEAAFGVILSTHQQSLELQIYKRSTTISEHSTSQC